MFFQNFCNILLSSVATWEIFGPANTWKIVGKTVYHFFLKKVAYKFAYIRYFLYLCSSFQE